MDINSHGIIEDKYDFDPSVIHNFSTRYVLFVKSNIKLQDGKFNCTLLDNKIKLNVKASFDVVKIPKDNSYLFLDVDDYNMKLLVQYLLTEEIEFCLKHLSMDIYRTYYASYHKKPRNMQLEVSTIQ